MLVHVWNHLESRSGELFLKCVGWAKKQRLSPTNIQKKWSCFPTRLERCSIKESSNLCHVTLCQTAVKATRPHIFGKGKHLQQHRFNGCLNGCFVSRYLAHCILPPNSGKSLAPPSPEGWEVPQASDAGGCDLDKGGCCSLGSLASTSFQEYFHRLAEAVGPATQLGSHAALASAYALKNQSAPNHEQTRAQNHVLTRGQNLHPVRQMPSSNVMVQRFGYKVSCTRMIRAACKPFRHNDGDDKNKGKKDCWCCSFSFICFMENVSLLWKVFQKRIYDRLSSWNANLVPFWPSLKSNNLPMEQKSTSGGIGSVIRDLRKVEQKENSARNDLSYSPVLPNSLGIPASEKAVLSELFSLDHAVLAVIPSFWRPSRKMMLLPTSDVLSTARPKSGEGPVTSATCPTLAQSVAVEAAGR